MILYFDVDGTLIPEGADRMPADTAAAIRRAQERGHLCMVNTGRTRSGLQKSLWDFPFDGYVLGCGSRILFHGEALFARSFSPETCSRILSLLEQYQIDAFLEGTEDVYTRRGRYRLETMNRVRDYFRSLGLGQGACIEDGGFVFDKFILMTEEGPALSRFLEEIAQWADVIPRERVGQVRTCECIQKGCSKSRAMQLIADKLGIPLSQTCAFGDSSNDLDMLRMSAHPVAMGRHSPELEECCEFITDTADNNGIGKALSRLGLI